MAKNAKSPKKQPASEQGSASQRITLTRQQAQRLNTVYTQMGQVLTNAGVITAQARGAGAGT